MTLVGCAMLWLVLLMLIVSVWVPVVGWMIVPVLAIFLGLQLLRYVMPAKETPGRDQTAETPRNAPVRSPTESNKK